MLCCIQKNPLCAKPRELCDSISLFFFLFYSETLTFGTFHQVLRFHYTFSEKAELSKKIVQEKLQWSRRLVSISTLYDEQLFGTSSNSLLPKLFVKLKGRKEIPIHLTRALWAVSSQGMQDDFGAKSTNWLAGLLTEYLRCRLRFRFYFVSTSSRQLGFLCTAAHFCKIRRVSYV